MFYIFFSQSPWELLLLLLGKGNVIVAWLCRFLGKEWFTLTLWYVHVLSYDYVEFWKLTFVIILQIIWCSLSLDWFDTLWYVDLHFYFILTDYYCYKEVIKSLLCAAELSSWLLKEDMWIYTQERDKVLCDLIVGNTTFYSFVCSSPMSGIVDATAI